MARTKYTVTFPAGIPGDEVTWPNTVTVFPDHDSPRPLGSASLDQSLMFTGWSEAASIVFTRPAGTNDTATVTSGSPAASGNAVPQPSGGSSAVSELLLTLAADFPLTGGDDFPTFQVGRQTGTDITLDNDGNTIIVHKTGLYLATLHPAISTSGATNPSLGMWIDCADAFNGELIQCGGLPIAAVLPVTGSGVLPAESRLAPNFQFFGGGTNALQSALTFVSVAGPL